MKNLIHSILWGTSLTVAWCIIDVVFHDEFRILLPLCGGVIFGVIEYSISCCKRT